MAYQKLEPRLATLIEQQKVRATARGLAVTTVEDQSIDVTISHQEEIRAAEQRDKTDQLRQLERKVSDSQKPILARLRELKVPDDQLRRHTLTNAITTSLKPRQMEAIAALDEVKLIRLEALEPVTCMNESVDVIEVPEARDDFGGNGRGIRVAILDSGVDRNHPALLGKVVDEISTAGEAVNIPGNHGTHVAGTVASNDPVYRGVAPQCDLINIKVLNAAGSGTPAAVINGLEQAVRRGALVASLSLGWSEIFHGWVCNDADCILCQAADNAVRLGVTVVVASGNEGSAGATPPFAVRHPGAARRVITVGAVDKAKALATFSSTGPGSGRLSPTSPIRLTKPDLSAPGVNIFSSVLGGGFSGLSGTSMATPHVSGVAALVLQANRSLTPMMVKKLLEETSEPLPYTPNQAGYGLVNAYGAVMRASMAVPRALAAVATEAA